LDSAASRDVFPALEEWAGELFIKREDRS